MAKNTTNSNSSTMKGRECMPPPAPVRVTVTGACGGIGSIVAMMIARGDLFGPSTLVDITLAETKNHMNALSKGMVVELGMCNLPLIYRLRCTDKLEKAFTDAQYIFLAGGFPMNPMFTREDCINGSMKEFKNNGIALQASGNRTAKILVIAEPQNVNMALIRHFAPELDPQQMTGLSRVDHNRCVAKLAKMLTISTSKVRCMSVWGNSGAGVFPDLRHSVVEVLGKVQDAYQAVGDDYYLKFDFARDIHSRSNQVYKKQNQAPSLTIANAAIQHARAWLRGTPSDDWTSMVVLSDGSYDVGKGMPFSFPVRVDAAGKWTIVDDLELDFFEKERIEEAEKVVRREIDFVYYMLGLLKDEKDENAFSKTWDFGVSEAIPCRILGPLERQKMAYSL